MSDFPFKKGDLVSLKWSFYNDHRKPREGVIVEIKDGGFFDVLINGEIESIHRNYIITPKIKAVKMTGGLK